MSILSNGQCRRALFNVTLLGNLRIGLTDSSLLHALAFAATMTRPNQPYPPKKLNCLKELNTEAAKAKVEENAIIFKNAFRYVKNASIE